MGTSQYVDESPRKARKSGFFRLGTEPIQMLDFVSPLSYYFIRAVEASELTFDSTIHALEWGELSKGDNIKGGYPICSYP
jgi:hypothetical protein